MSRGRDFHGKEAKVSFKTDRLAALFPDVYAANERDSLLHRLLDGLAAELLAGDAAVKDLLKSHWIDYARGGGLDGLAALFGVSRRRLGDGTPESDATFRALLKSTVQSFVGGGTVEAVKGSVRAALGLPYDLALLQGQIAAADGRLAPGAARLIAGLADLVQIEEFSPKAEVVLGNASPTTAGSATTLAVNFTTVEPVAPRIEWRFSQGGGRHLSVVRQDSGAGVVSRDAFVVPEGSTLVLAGDGAAGFSASIGSVDVSSAFVDVDGMAPPVLPEVPAGGSQWIFSAAGAGEFEHSSYDLGATFDAAAFTVRMAWIRYQPLTFDVVVPYFVDAAVKRILAGTGYEKRFTVFKGLSLDAIQKVVDQQRAAGVRGMVQYSLALPGESSEQKAWEDQGAVERFSVNADHRHSETLDASEELLVGALGSALETHDASERFAIGGIFDVAVADGSFGFH
jgi:hypothetical protein